MKAVMKHLAILPLATSALLPLAHLQADEPPGAPYPSIVGSPSDADMEELPEFVTEATGDEAELDPAHAAPAIDLEGAAIAEDVP